MPQAKGKLRKDLESRDGGESFDPCPRPTLFSLAWPRSRSSRAIRARASKQDRNPVLRFFFPLNAASAAAVAELKPCRRCRSVKQESRLADCVHAARSAHSCRCQRDETVRFRHGPYFCDLLRDSKAGKSQAQGQAQVVIFKMDSDRQQQRVRNRPF